MVAQARKTPPTETETQENQEVRRRSVATKRSERTNTDTEDRLDLRTETAIKGRWQKAADLLGVPLSAFAKMALSERADRIIADHESMTLNREDSLWFVNFLKAAPQEPTEKMRQSIEARRRLLGE